MKKITLLALLFVGFTLTKSHAQSIKLKYNGNDVTNKTINIKGYTGDGEIKTYLVVTNSSTKSVPVIVKKWIKANDTIAGTENYFCWFNCYSPWTYESMDTIDFAPGKEDKDSFQAYLQSYGHAGKNTITFTWYNLKDKNDSTNVTFVYDILTGIKDFALNKLDVYPTPASNLLYMNLPSNTAAVNVELSDITGKMIRKLQPKEGLKNDQVILNVEGIPNGVYFLNVYNAHFQGTKKVIISN